MATVRTLVARSLPLALALAALPSALRAQCQTGVLTSSANAYRVAIDGDTLATARNYPSGRMEIFRRQAGVWSSEAVLPLTQNPVDLQLSGDTLVVGAPGEAVGGASYVGKVWVYQRTAGVWSLAQEILPDPPDVDRYFGEAVALDGDTLVIGESGQGTGAAGRAHVYTRQGGTWTLQAVLSPYAGSPFPFDLFGTSLSLQGERLAVGAPGGYVPPFLTGEVFVYERTGTTWNVIQHILPGDDGMIDFGRGVRLDGSALAISGGTPRVSIAIFDESAGVWTQSAEFFAPGPFQSWGRFFSLSGARLLVGQADDDDAGAYAGTAWVYRRNAGVWSLSDKLFGDDIHAGSGFGADLEEDAGTAAMTSAGGVYLFALDDPSCPEATFAAVPARGTAPLNVAFTDQSTGVVTDWSWSFGDGASSLARDPNHVYAATGRYTVDFLARGPAGVDREIQRDFVYVGTGASATSRNGTGLNPARLASLSLPVIGSTWSAESDTSAHPGATLALLQGRARPLTGRTTPWGELLIDQRSSWLFTRVLAPDAQQLARFDFPLPDDLALDGFHLATQGGILGGRAELLNALDLVVGF